MSGSTDDFPDECCEKYCSYNSKKQKLSFNPSITDVICRIVQIYGTNLYRSATPTKNKDHSKNVGDNLMVAEMLQK